jgi:hypothetical protein
MIGILRELILRNEMIGGTSQNIPFTKKPDSVTEIGKRRRTVQEFFRFPLKLYIGVSGLWKLPLFPLELLSTVSTGDFYHE